MANNQSVNSWFIQRLKSILQGSSASSGASTKAHQAAGPPSAQITGKRYEPHDRREAYLWEQARWQQEHAQLLMQQQHAAGQRGNPTQSQTMAASQKQ